MYCSYKRVIKLDMRKNVCANFSYYYSFQNERWQEPIWWAPGDELKREFRVITERKSYNCIWNNSWKRRYSAVSSGTKADHQLYSSLSRRRGEGKGGHEAWDRETMFSQLAKWSRCVMVSSYLRSFSQINYFRGEKRTSKGNDSLKEKKISCLLALFSSHIVFVLWYWNCKTQATLTEPCKE